MRDSIGYRGTTQVWQFLQPLVEESRWQLLTARTIDSTFTCSPCNSGTCLTMYTRADIKIPSSTICVQVPSISQNNNKNIFHATRRDATKPPLNHIPAPQKPSKRQHTSSKDEGTNTLMGQYQNHIRDLTHTPNPYRIKKSRKPQSQKPSAAEKHTAHQPGGKRGGENLLGGYDESARTRSQRSFWWWW